jgi:anti-anti-sigma factor
MAVSAHTSSDGKTMTITVSDRFDFSLHRDWRSAYESSEKLCSNYIIDLNGVTYMDSSALGMLLQLWEYAGSSKNAIHIKNAGPAIRDILRIANFDKWMVID